MLHDSIGGAEYDRGGGDQAPGQIRHPPDHEEDNDRDEGLRKTMAIPTMASKTTTATSTTIVERCQYRQNSMSITLRLRRTTPRSTVKITMKVRAVLGGGTMTIGCGITTMGKKGELTEGKGCNNPSIQGAVHTRSNVGCGVGPRQPEGIHHLARRLPGA